MNHPSRRDMLLVELERERSIRRTVRLLSAKGSKIREDLDSLISHLTLLVAIPLKTADPEEESAILIEAAKRLEDPIFTDLIIQIIQERKN